ncbi:MAG: RNA methyltransferase [Pseudomonadota bacterium]
MTDPATHPLVLPAFVLVRPQMGENIGASARAMLNFGLDRMRIVDPRDGWPNPKAVAMASGAGRVLDAAQVTSNTAEAVADCDYVVATTARARGLTAEILSPEEAMTRLWQKAQAGQKTAVLFGPERAGLENDDIARANALVNVPVNPEFASLNLAQCVLLMGYEWRKAALETQPSRMDLGKSEWAPQVEIEHLAQHFEDRLETAGFFFPEHKAPGMKINLRNLWSRMPLTRSDVQMFHGMLRQIVWWKENDDTKR